MRPDLAKCTTESPRGGRAYAMPKKYGGKVHIVHDHDHEYLDEYGGFRSSSRYRHHDYKSFSDCLGALRGNIRKSVGRRWDDVFSEFCRLLDRRGVSGYHIWTHLQYEVQMKAFLGEDGEIYELGRYGNTSKVDGYYVHPITGILCYRKLKPQYRWWKPKEEKISIPVPGEPDWYYQKIDGLWFRVREHEVEKDVPWKHWSGEWRFRTESAIVPYEKRSANRKEIQWIRGKLPR